MIGIGMQLSATAQDSLTIDQCRAMAVEHNRQLQQAREQREKSGYDVMAMQATSCPSLTFKPSISSTPHRAVSGGLPPLFPFIHTTRRWGSSCLLCLPMPPAM